MPVATVARLRWSKPGMGPEGRFRRVGAFSPANWGYAAREAPEGGREKPAVPSGGNDRIRTYDLALMKRKLRTRLGWNVRTSFFKSRGDQ